MRRNQWKNRINEIYNEVDKRIDKNGEKMYTSKIKREDIKDQSSRLNLDCNGCNQSYTPTVDCFMKIGTNCKCWAGNLPWSNRFDDLLTKIANRIDKNGKQMYSTSRILPKDILSARSILDLDCNGCNTQYTPTVTDFVSGGYNCRCWSNTIAWSKRSNEVLMEISKRIDDNGDPMYDSSGFRKEDISNLNSRLNLKCNNCNHPYTPTINDFMHIKSNCRCWDSALPWAMRFDEITTEISKHIDDNGNPMYDSSGIRKEDIKDQSSRLNLNCNGCNLPYTPVVNHFMNNKSDCPCWNDRIPWIKRFEEITDEISRRIDDNGNPMYESSGIRKEDITNQSSRFNLNCNGCNQPYIPTVNDFMNHKNNCPCWTENGYSKISVEWLNYISRRDNITIQHVKNGGEYRIYGTKYRADGYCRSTNTIYEFHGDYWHGNPKVYDANFCNAHTKKTMGQLYQETLDREKIIKDLGYNLVTIWETEWKEYRKINEL